MITFSQTTWGGLMAGVTQPLPKETLALPLGRVTSQPFSATLKTIVGEQDNESGADTLWQKKLTTSYTGKVDTGVSSAVVLDDTDSGSAPNAGSLQQDTIRTSHTASAEPAVKSLSGQGALLNEATDSRSKVQFNSLSVNATNGSLLSKYAVALGVSTAELVNAANLVQLGNSVNDINYFLTGGGAALSAANAGVDVPYDDAQGVYIKGLIGKLKKSANAITSCPGGTNGGSFSSFFGYDASGSFVGDLPGGRPVGDLHHLDATSGKTVVSTYKYDPASQVFRRLDAAGMTTLDIYSGPTITMHTEQAPVASGSADLQSKSY